MSNDILNPAAIEAHIREISNRIAKSAKVCDERYRAFLDAEAKHEYERALADESAEGSIPSKKNQAIIATYELRKARDVADAAYKYADRLAKALESELRAYQSIGASVRAMYSVAGRGEAA